MIDTEETSELLNDLLRDKIRDLRQAQYSSPLFLSQASNQFLSYFLQLGKGFYSSDVMVPNKKLSSQSVNKRASIEPWRLFEEQLLQDVDSMLEANYKNPIVPLQALWLTQVTCQNNDAIHA